MSAPPGWHLQPDGRERYWDGSQWTEQFRMPAGGDPTAGTTVQLYYRTLYQWQVDTPGNYALQVVFTISSP